MREMRAADGTPVADGTMPLDPARGRCWKLGQIEVWHWPQAQGGRWGCIWANAYGVGGCRTPLGALWAIACWRREP
jgi:hypothetical protein